MAKGIKSSESLDFYIRYGSLWVVEERRRHDSTETITKKYFVKSDNAQAYLKRQYDKLFKEYDAIDVGGIGCTSNSSAKSDDWHYELYWYGDTYEGEVYPIDLADRSFEEKLEREKEEK